MTTRTLTRSGMLRAGAFLTRSGQVPYKRSELNLDGNPDEIVMVERTVDSLTHPVTIDTLLGAPLTVGHPPPDQAGQSVRPNNYRDVAVGSVAGMPFMQGDLMRANVLVGDETALKRLDDGEDELSIGYEFVLDDKTMRTVGPLYVNHVAIVPKGRAGEQVRVLDAHPVDNLRRDTDLPAEDEGADMAETMSKDEITSMVDSAVTKAFDAMMRKRGMFEGEDADAMKRMVKDELPELIGAALAPVSAQVTAMQTAQDEAAAAQAQADATAAATKAADDLRTEVRTQERERFAVLTDAAPLIADEATVKSLADADTKTILVAALTDAIPDAANMDVGFLRGALAMAAKQKQATDAAPDWQNPAGGAPAGRADGDGLTDPRTGLPAGVVAFDANRHTNAQDARTKAERTYIDAQAKAYAEAGGR